MLKHGIPVKPIYRNPGIGEKYVQPQDILFFSDFYWRVQIGLQVIFKLTL